MRSILLFCLLASCLCFYGSAQAQDTLQHRIDLLNEKAFSLKRNSVTQAFALLATAEQLAIRSGYQRGLAITYLYQGGIFQQSGFNKKALALFYQSLAISRERKDTFNAARANQQIALALKDNKETDSAEQLLKQTMRVYRNLRKPDDVVNIQNSLGLISMDKKNWGDALLYFDSAATAGKAAGYVYGQKKASYNMGLLYMQQEQPGKAAAFFKTSIVLSDSMHDAYGTAACNIQLANIAQQAGMADSALYYATQAYRQSAAVSALQLQSDAVRLLMQVYERRGQKDQLLAWQKEMINLQQRIYDTDKSYATGFVDMIKSQEFKNQAALQQIASVQQTSKTQQWLLIIVGILLGLLLLTGVPIYFNYKKASMLTAELSSKNNIIQRNAASLDQLNKAISRQNQKLEEENKLKDKLLSIISHDLRHPLVNTKSILDLINLKLVNPRETEELLEQLEHQYVRSLSLLDNLLYWIRTQMKGLKIDRAPVNMNQLIASIIEEQRVPMLNKNVRVTNQTDARLQWLAEKEMIKIIFRNLLSNALKFTPSEGDVYFSSVIDEEHAYILIRDTGVGMTKDVIAKINARQYFSSKGTANEKGSGFGLILVQELLEKHEADLLIESEPGRGSVLAVKFALT
ncbi:tetratricopeptide repeat-containing sensor histidine kinase [Deminuibacter soli]|uniref:histidine kinase n=1 Tax=Deminuibacter soli TaxID=2291815 RepID=A0A3E1NPN0_9BACT|nr:tetratricopeptide repeat-containing sensor histidine kinase [Deminuibacter soli]RFM29784.1 hypothetical protein DXN05_02055 [Deminuibacter soli]